MAGFRVRQNSLATAAGAFGVDSPNGPAGQTYYSGVDTTSTGYELVIAGKLSDRWNLSGGYTYYKLSDDSGGNPRPCPPNRTLKLASTVTLWPPHELQVGRGACGGRTGRSTSIRV